MGEDLKSGEGAWRMIGHSLRPSLPWVVFGSFNAIAMNGLRILIPLFVKQAVDRGMSPYDGGELTRWAIAILVVSVLTTVTFSTQWYVVFKVALRTEADLRQRLFDQFQRLHFAFHDRARTGELMARATTDLQQIQNLVIWIPVVSATVLIVFAVAAVLFTMSPSLTLLAMAPLLVFFAAALRYSTGLDPLSVALQESLAGVSGVAEESITGIRVVKGFGAESAQTRRMRDRADDVYGRGMALARLRSNYAPFLQQVPMLGIVAVLYVGGREVVSGHLTVGQLVAFVAYILLLVTPLGYAAELIAAFSRGAASARRVNAVLNIAPEIADASDARDLPTGPGEVRFDGVKFSYGEMSPTLNGFDLTIRPGEVVALVGRTGSGKSTVARLIPRFYDASAGAISIDGVDIRTVRLRSLRQAVSIVFEDTFLFTATIRSNIAFGQPNATLDQIKEAARLAGVHDFISELPRGYDTVLGESGFSLSGGQRQRLAIARAILADPRVLILDDATSAVDPTKEHEIRAALEEVTRGRTTVIIGHRPATIALADRVVVIDGGTVAAEGKHDDLLRSSKLYAQILAQAEQEDRALVDSDNGPPADAAGALERPA